MGRFEIKRLLCNGLAPLLMAHLLGCAKGPRGGGGADALRHAAASAPATGPSNAPIDLTVADPKEPLTDAELFDESVIFAPNFALDQNDPALSDLFSQRGSSELCVPTSIAEAAIYLMAYHSPRFDKLALDGLAADRHAIEPNALVRQLAKSCKTDVNDGTNTVDALACVLGLFHGADYVTDGTQLISPFKSSTTLPVTQRPVTIRDMRTAVAGGLPMLLEVKWFAYDASHRSWQESGGHVVAAFGYDYDTAWGEDEIQLKVVNPELDYGADRQSALFDTITIQRYSAEAGITYPPDRPFIVSGNGFSGRTKRGYVGEILAFGLQQ